jgi:hypothetical protein
MKIRQMYIQKVAHMFISRLFRHKFKILNLTLSKCLLLNTNKNEETKNVEIGQIKYESPQNCKFEDLESFTYENIGALKKL